VLVVPGNHERARVDVPLLLRHPNLHVLAQPRTVVLPCAGTRIAFGGFGYERGGVRARFPDALARTGLLASRADIRVLCMHHCVEGATCGPGDFTFRDAADVVRARDLPAGVAVVFTGHIHRHQFLERDRAGGSLPAPVLYPGSVERTSFAEKDETKGFAVAELEPDDHGRGQLARWTFHPLPARPMVVADIPVLGATRRAVEHAVAEALQAAPADAVLRLRLNGTPSADAAPALRAETLRAQAPRLNVSVVCAGPGHRSHWK
jgi:DNA repair exonuclease SbcCD nuclease subunit